MSTIVHDDKHVLPTVQVDPSTRLYPATFIEPTSREMVQFEFAGSRTSLPMTSCAFRRDSQVTPSQCPPRLRVLTLQRHSWARAPSEMLSVHELKLSDVRGWSMLCDQPVRMLAVHIPEEDRALDVLELVEHEDLLRFHAQTLELYSAICSHGNNRIAHYLTRHVSQEQVLALCQQQYLSGTLRIAAFDLLIALHIAPLAEARLITEDEYIVPLEADDEDEQATTIRPHLDMSDRPALGTDNLVGRDVMIRGDASPPSFPYRALKQICLEALIDGIRKGVSHMRDPIGGSYENLFV